MRHREVPGGVGDESGQSQSFRVRGGRSPLSDTPFNPEAIGPFIDLNNRVNVGVGENTGRIARLSALVGEGVGLAKAGFSFPETFGAVVGTSVAMSALEKPARVLVQRVRNRIGKTDNTTSNNNNRSIS